MAATGLTCASAHPAFAGLAFAAGCTWRRICFVRGSALLEVAPVEVLVWLFSWYARYFVAVFLVAAVLLGLIWLASLRSHPRTSPEPVEAQSSAPDGTEAA
jgi:hypothetical protein